MTAETMTNKIFKSKIPARGIGQPCNFQIHKNIEGNEKADELYRMGMDGYGPELRRTDFYPILPLKKKYNSKTTKNSEFQMAEPD